MQRRALLLALTAFAATLALTSTILGQLARREVEERRAVALELARASGFAVEQAFSASHLAASSLAAMVVAGASDAELDGVARSLLETIGGGATLQLARDGVISHTWPLAGNERAVGLDIIAHPVHGPYSRLARDLGRPLVYGPFQLVQGGTGLALRVPIFLPGREGAPRRFWGLASAVLRLPDLLERSRLTRLVRGGFDFEMTRRRPQGGEEEIIHSTRAEGERLADPVAVDVPIPGQSWTLAVEPHEGWRSPGPRALQAGALLVAVLAGLLAYRVLSLPETLRREVAARTAELTEAHAAQRRAEEAQRQSQKLEAVGLLAGGVAHDFNNLLVGILGYADLLAEQARPGSLEDEAARTISQAAQRGAGLTRQLLAFARMGQRREADVDVHALVREVVALLDRTLDKSIRVETRLEAAESRVRGDPGQLQQVLLNLAVNARDAMPGGGLLTLSTALREPGEAGVPRDLAPGRALVVTVADTGTGISPEHLPRLFEPFFTTKPEGKGTGLGLATVYGIVKAHGGAVTVEGAPGRGARFSVALPLAGPASDVAGEEHGAAPRGQGRVLVVDDEEVVRRTAARLLASLGYEAITVEGGQEAVDWVAARRGEPLAAVLLDLGMPGMDGATCFRRLREVRPGVPVIVCSGFSRAGVPQALLDEGAAAFVQKPYRVDELARALAGAAAGPTLPGRATP